MSQRKLRSLHVTSEMDSENEGWPVEREQEHVSGVSKTGWLKCQAVELNCRGSNPGSTLC